MVFFCVDIMKLQNIYLNIKVIRTKQTQVGQKGKRLSVDA